MNTLDVLAIEKRSELPRMLYYNPMAAAQVFAGDSFTGFCQETTAENKTYDMSCESAPYKYLTICNGM